MKESEAKHLSELDEYDLDKDLMIDVSSVVMYEKTLLENQHINKKYHKWAAQAEKEVLDLDLELKVLVAEITEELIANYLEEKKKEPPTTWVAGLNKTHIPLDRRWVKLTRKYNEAKSNKTYIDGLVKSHDVKGFSLNNLTRLLEKVFVPDSGFFSPDLQSSIQKEVGEKIIRQRKKSTEKELDEACNNLKLNME